MIRIGELASRSGVSTRALRYYEEHHLLPAERTTAGQRLYPESAVERVQMIQGLYAAGLASRSIAVLLPCVDNAEATDEALGLLWAERERIDQQILDLVQTRARLDEVITRATVPEACTSVAEQA
ncbi:MerR family transcriptional regulator [Kineosporia babensis]|uniref:MerR family transcriptional regulator n=1 Tax=Kineosporia babensis TaxID=499548 RepID=A0A9X1NIL9_9ACTN|nr:MerR family transcriptional regulator [Kineosporia babensis]MCD5314504.1 MerR family transcriptional regulator [Kineosporia babensis]